MNTKKKILILCGVILVSAGLIYGANLIKAKVVSNNKVTAEETNKKETVNKKETASKKEEKNKVVDNKDNSTNATTEENVNKEQSEEKTPAENKTEEANSNSTTNKVTTEEPKPVVIEEKSKSLINIEIIDEAKKSFSNKNFSMEFTDGETLNDVMKRFLPQYGSDYKMANGYLSKLYGLKEKENGPYSGWTLYINGVKSSVGVNDIILKNGDSIILKSTIYHYI